MVSEYKDHKKENKNKVVQVEKKLHSSVCTSEPEETEIHSMSQKKKKQLKIEIQYWVGGVCILELLHQHRYYTHINISECLLTDLLKSLYKCVCPFIPLTCKPGV